MGDWIKVHGSLENVKLDDASYDEYKNEVLTRLKKNKAYYDYVFKLLDGKDEEALDKSLTNIDTFLEYREKFNGDEKLIGKDGLVPLLKYDDNYNKLTIYYRYTKAEKERQIVLKNFIVSDNINPEVIFNRGKTILNDLSTMPKACKPSPFLKDAKQVFSKLTPYLLKGQSTKGLLFSNANKNGNTLLDFVAYLGSKTGKTVSLLSSGITFSNLAMPSYNKSAKDEKDLVNEANSNLLDSRDVDILCIYNLDFIPRSKYFIESIFLPFLSNRLNEGKLTFVTINDSYKNFIGSLAFDLATRKKFSSIFSQLMDEFEVSVDQNYF